MTPAASSPSSSPSVRRPVPAVPGNVVLLLSALLVVVTWLSHVPTSVARTADVGSSSAPATDVLTQAFLPSPSEDPWYNLPAPEETTAPGTVLDVRSVSIPFDTIWVPHRSYQLRFRSSDSRGAPISVVTTVVVPSAPTPGGGPRPLVSLDTPIDSLGLRCTPSWTLTHTPRFEPFSVPNEMLSRGWALVITDHQGPLMAYAAGRLAGHAVLDGVRAARSFPPAGLGDSPVVLNGYSGGAIASGWAAELQPTYAPELRDVIVGVVAGGTPSDPSLLFETMDGKIGSGLFRSAIIGIAREYPELRGLFNHYGVAMAAWPMRDICAQQGELTGLFQVPIALLAVDPGVRENPVVASVMAENRMGASAPQVPVLLFHGSASLGIGDQFIPEHGVLALRDTWCAGGAHVEYLPVFGEHMVAPLSARAPTFAWMADRFAGRPLPPGCRGAGPV